MALSRGYNHSGHFRNAPGLLGLRLKERLGWDGRYRIDELPKLVEEMLTSPITMNGNPGVIAERVRQVPQLLQCWQRAFGERTPPSFDGVARAIAAWSAAHDGGDTAVDAALRGDASALSPRAAEGLRLFTGKAGCSGCHSGPAFSDGLAHRLGVPESPQILRDPERTVALLAHHASHGSADPMSERSDTGVHALTRRASTGDASSRRACGAWRRPPRTCTTAPCPISRRSSRSTTAAAAAAPRRSRSACPRASAKRWWRSSRR